MKKALITKLTGGNYTLMDLETREFFNAVASGKLRYQMVDETSAFAVQRTRRTKIEPQRLQVSPKVGDHVIYNDSEDKILIEEILPRKNELTRPDLANLDQMILVFSAVEPEFSFNLLDRLLITMYQAKVPVRLIVTKIDLASFEKLLSLKTGLKYYETIGITTTYVNGLNYLRSDLTLVFNNKVSALSGQTGVGKSTLLNTLIPEISLKTQAISKALGRGKHTTRHAELFSFENGFIADTAGFSKIDFKIFYHDELKEYYPDFLNLSDKCQFRSRCNHLNEPKCEVKRLVDDQSILQSRYANYVTFVNEIMNQKEIY